MLYLKKSLNLISLCCFLFVLFACGGGGSGNSTSTRTDFPLRQALRDYNSKSYEISFTISGTINGVNVSGTGTLISADAVAANFEGKSGFSATNTFTANITGNGVTLPLDVSSTYYFDSNYLAIGYTDSESYNVTDSTQVPVSVSLNDSGEVGMETQYTDSSKTTITGTTESSYEVISQDGNTVMIELTEVSYNPEHVETGTDVSTYSLTKTGVVTLISIKSTSASGILTFDAE